jgi:hypothetical protein
LPHILFYRKYREAYQARDAERAAFSEAFAHRYGRRAPSGLNRLPEFSEWLQDEVGKAMESVDKPSRDVEEASRLPEIVATGYRAMYAHGIHFKIRQAEEEKVTSDSGVVAAIWERRRSREFNSGNELDTAEYVGWVEEILELNYRSHCCIVLVCSWIPYILESRNAKVERNRYGFTLGNFHTTKPIGPNSFAFPIQCQQVFFSDDEKWNAERGGDWKVICGTEVRGRRGNLDMYRPDIQMLALNRDSDYDGLRGL